MALILSSGTDGDVHVSNLGSKNASASSGVATTIYSLASLNYNKIVGIYATSSFEDKYANTMKMIDANGDLSYSVTGLSSFSGLTISISGDTVTLTCATAGSIYEGASVTFGLVVDYI